MQKFLRKTKKRIFPWNFFYKDLPFSDVEQKLYEPYEQIFVNKFQTNLKKIIDFNKYYIIKFLPNNVIIAIAIYI